MAKVSDIYDFIDRAVKSRQYAENTALGLKAALRLFEKYLNEEEKQSVEKIKANLDQIYNQVFNKNKDMSAGSLATYKFRVRKVINDYEQYGKDATKMASWSPKRVTRSGRKKGSTDEAKSLDALSSSVPGSSHRIELALRADTKCLLIIPMDLNANDVKKIKGVLDSMVNNA